MDIAWDPSNSAVKSCDVCRNDDIADMNLIQLKLEIFLT